MRFLLVEDDRMIGDSLRAALRHQGHAVDWVRDAQAADSTLASERFDLALLDLGLPRGSGLDVLRTMRARGDGTPVIVLTPVGRRSMARVARRGTSQCFCHRGRGRTSAPDRYRSRDR
jgi:DNA-binding response OmpR family regulator